MKYEVEHKPKTSLPEKWLVLDTTPLPPEDPLAKGHIGLIIAECDTQEKADLVCRALNFNTLSTG